MNITGLPVSMVANSVQSRVDIAVLDNLMESNDAMGAGLINMIDSAAMERSVNPDVGGNIDLRI
ncbi:MAG: YjfB family protein [Lachnospiraceae bacterium]|nr:YjfB family protein [Lachnospiraceae bacterium]